MELVQSSRDGSGLSHTLWDISLMIDLAPSVIGPMTTPELSHILHDTRELYHVITLAIPIVPAEDDHTHQSFSFTIYMLLVNKNEVFPRLTVNTPFLSICGRIYTCYQCIFFRVHVWVALLIHS